MVTRWPRTSYTPNSENQVIYSRVTYIGLFHHDDLTSLQNHKRMDSLKKVIGMNLLFFNNNFLILNKVFEILNF